MRIIEQSFEILTPEQDELELLKWWEKIARVCYKSEDKITDDSALKLFRKLKYDFKHESVFEHINFTVKFITNRGVTHELVRHRIASYSQESTRYCNYGKDKFGKEITVILPVWFENLFDEESEMFSEYDPNFHEAMSWSIAMESAESAYFGLLNNGQKSQQARGVLPIDLKTEIVVTANLREWWHIFELRTSTAAHPQIKKLMVGLLLKLHSFYPNLFDITILAGL